MRTIIAQLQSVVDVLSASKTSDLIKKNPDKAEVIQKLSDTDPSPTKKYMEWGLKQVLAGEDVDNVIANIFRFHTNLGRMREKDINAYADLAALKQAFLSMAKPGKAAVKTQGTKDAVVIWQDARHVVYCALTTMATRALGTGTSWCVSSSGFDKWFRTYSDANKYIYICVDKQPALLRDNGQQPLSKIAITIDSDGRKVVYDADDEECHPDSQYLKAGIPDIKTILSACASDRASRPDTKESVALSTGVAPGAFYSFELHFDEDNYNEDNDEEDSPRAQDLSKGVVAEHLKNGLDSITQMLSAAGCPTETRKLSWPASAARPAGRLNGDGVEFVVHTVEDIKKVMSFIDDNNYGDSDIRVVQTEVPYVEANNWAFYPKGPKALLVLADEVHGSDDQDAVATMGIEDWLERNP